MEIFEITEPFILYLDAELAPAAKDQATFARVTYPDGRSILAVPIDDGLGQKSFTVEGKAALWKAIDRVATSWENKFNRSAEQAFETDKRNVAAILNGAKQKSLQRKATVDWQEVITDVAHYLETEGGEQWRAKFTPLIQGVMTSQNKQWAATLGLEFDVASFFAGEWFDKYTLQFAQPINETTLEGLSTMLQQAEMEGWSIPTTQRHMEQMFEQWASGGQTAEDFNWYAERLPAHRTEMIARTETMRASNAGAQQQFTEWGVKRKEWVSTLDDRVRDSHAAVDGQQRDIEEPFEVGGESLSYPGDPAGSPENTINCRCTEVPVME